MVQKFAVLRCYFIRPYGPIRIRFGVSQIKFDLIVKPYHLCEQKQYFARIEIHPADIAPKNRQKPFL